MTCIIRSSLVVILYLLIHPSLKSQTLAPYDSAFDRRISAAWKEVQAFNSRTQTQPTLPDPQRLFASEFLGYYAAHPDTKVGRKAIQSAFFMWSNLGDAHSIRSAMIRIKSDSDIWPFLLNSIGNAYARDKRWDEFLGLLDTLSRTLSQPRSLAEVLLKLGSENLFKSNDLFARQYYSRVLALKADSSQKTQASQGLYEIDSLGIGAMAPDFFGISVQGQPIRLSEMRGINVLLEFTGTWCGPCQGELPFLKEAFSKCASRNLSFVAVSLDDSASVVNRYLAEKQVSWPHILAPEHNDNPIVRKYNVQGIPRIFLIDTLGRIASKNLRQAGVITAIEKLGSN